MTDNRTTELLPCPFCGGEAVLDKVDEGADYRPWFWYTVHCSNRDCVCASLCQEYETEAEAIAAWNTRAERTCRNDKDKWSGLAKYLFVCSECGWNLVDVGNDAIDISARLMKRCPMCGAKVIGG